MVTSVRKLISFDHDQELKEFWQRLPRSIKKRCRYFPRTKTVCMDSKDFSRIQNQVTQLSKKQITVEDDKVYKLHSETIPWGVRKVGALGVWRRVQGSGVRIGIIDTGIDRSHPDLRGRVTGGVNVMGSGSPFIDRNGHGTHIAGTIAAALNGSGITGIAPGASLYAIKAFGADGTGSSADVIEGIEWAIENSMDILNMSFGSGQGSRAERNAINAARDAGIVMIAASGNSGGSVDYPARYSGVIAVGAIDIRNRVPAFSSRGRGLNFVEPGVNILSTWPGGGYRKLSGTSMAAAHLTGIAAIFLAYYKKLSPAGLFRLLKRSAATLSVPRGRQGNGVVTLKYLGRTRK